MRVKRSNATVGAADPVTTPNALPWLALTTKRTTARKLVNWRQLLKNASIPESPGYTETVERCLQRKAAGLVMKSAAQKKAKGAKR